MNIFISIWYFLRDFWRMLIKSSWINSKLMEASLNNRLAAIWKFSFRFDMIEISPFFSNSFDRWYDIDIVSPTRYKIYRIKNSISNEIDMIWEGEGGISNEEFDIWWNRYDMGGGGIFFCVQKSTELILTQSSSHPRTDDLMQGIMSCLNLQM